MGCQVVGPASDSTKLQPTVAALIGLVEGENNGSLGANRTFASLDGRSFYVGLSSLGKIAVVDTVALQQVDTRADDETDPREHGDQ